MTSDQSRRGFIALAGAGAAGAAGAVVLGTATEATAATKATKLTTVPAGADEPLVAYVRDAHTGEVAVMVGDREVVVHDRELAARIARAAH